MQEDEPPNLFYYTEPDPRDLDSFERFRLDTTDPDAPMVIGERLIPNAYRSGASALRNTRVSEALTFEKSNAPEEAKAAFRRFMEQMNANRP